MAAETNVDNILIWGNLNRCTVHDGLRHGRPAVMMNCPPGFGGAFWYREPDTVIEKPVVIANMPFHVLGQNDDFTQEWRSFLEEYEGSTLLRRCSPLGDYSDSYVGPVKYSTVPFECEDLPEETLIRVLEEVSQITRIGEKLLTGFIRRDVS